MSTNDEDNRRYCTDFTHSIPAPEQSLVVVALETLCEQFGTCPECWAVAGSRHACDEHSGADVPNEG